MNGAKSPADMPRTAMIAPDIIIATSILGLSRNDGIVAPKAFAIWHTVTKRNGIVIASSLGI